MTRISWPLLAVLIAAASCEARADDALDIARLVAHESGLRSPADGDAIVAVLLNGSQREGMTPAAFARAYAPRFAAHTSRQSWVWRLDRRAHDPLAGISWADARPHWLALLMRTETALAASPICAATDWSSRSHMRRRIRAGAQLRVIDCGTGTLNAFAIRGQR